MTLSIIIPYYDETIFIRQTVASCLLLGNALHEVIIVNDGPKDLIAAHWDDLAGAEKVRVIKNPVNLGHPGSRNVGIEHASGELLMFLDADDWLVPNCMLSGVKFAQQSQADITHLPTLSYRPRFGAWERFERDRRILAKRASGMTIDDAPEMRYTVATWSWIFRRDFLIETGVRLDATQQRYVDHVFALDALQKARQLATFDRYPHIWRRRGASMSTSAESDEQFEFLIDSITKASDLLLPHYAADSTPFQRELAFSAARLLGEWDLLRVCIPARASDPGKAQLLTKLAREFGRFELQQAIVDDPLLKRIYRKGIHREPFASIALDQVPQLYGLIAQEAWDEIASILEIGPEGIPVTDDAFANVRMDLPPALALWESYATLVTADNSMEHRLFTEFLLDEIDAYCGQLKDSDFPNVPAKWPRDMSAVMAQLADRFDATLPPIADANQAKFAELRETAEATTNAYVRSKIGVEIAGVPLRSEVLEAWRAWESAFMGDAMDAMTATILQRGEESSKGDANWQAKRTIKSRLRAKVVEPLTGR
ncbi:glycosyltransferase family 2 protein [Altererythrobacter lutimaris]|uniref:Glycosyltransferase family 2 protein n=1 Tax=Altererythrobacter lutimaris TaxID=2743979 RepID=A0A850HG75_9SPHN|nr:glycosyltransferase family 2 protein [Altererythrobacter lutimaris]NVE93632.1 glycosyltransferase family 2 protein [Altererythrobacter lutimaris]